MYNIEISQTIDTIEGKASVQRLSVLYGRVGGARVLVALSVPSATALMVFWPVHPWLWLFNYDVVVKVHFRPAFSCYYLRACLILEGQLRSFLGGPFGSRMCIRGVRIFSCRSASPIVNRWCWGRLCQDFPFLDCPPTSAFASSRHVNQYSLFGRLVIYHLPAFPFSPSCCCGSFL